MRRALLGLAAALLAAAPAFAAELAGQPAHGPAQTLSPVLPGLKFAPTPLYQATVRLEPAAMAAAMAGQKKSFEAATADFSGMYTALRQQARSQALPVGQRAALAEAIASRYAAYFDALLSEPGFAEPTRTVAARMRDRLRDGSLVKGILYADRVERRADRLAKVLRAKEAGEAVATPAAGEPWNIQPPVPASERTRKPGRQRVFTVSMPTLERRLDDLSARLERGLEGAEREAFARWAEQTRRQAQRVGETSIRRTLLQGKEHRIWRIPANRGLRLIPTRGGFVIAARFKSSIADRRVWKIVKDSIEKEWHGSFRYAGKTLHLRTEVSIEPLGEDEKAGNDFLILREGRQAASHAGEQGITLTRDFDYLTPAHEFGHVVGLPDEYTETYDFAAMSARHVAPLASLMANSHYEAGIVQARHLKLAYQLLRRRRLVRPASSKR